MRVAARFLSHQELEELDQSGQPLLAEKAPTYTQYLRYRQCPCLCVDGKCVLGAMLDVEGAGPSCCAASQVAADSRLAMSGRTLDVTVRQLASFDTHVARA